MRTTTARPTRCPEHRTRYIVAAFESYICPTARCGWEAWYSPDDEAWVEADVLADDADISPKEAHRNA